MRHTEKRLRPEEGWLTLLLLAAVVATLVAAVIMADWVPEVRVVAWTAFLGLLMSAGLGRRPLDWRPAWALLLAYGLALTTIWLGRLVPPARLIFSGWWTSSAHVRQNWGLFVDRVGGWLQAALGGGRSEETIVFAFVLALLAWLLAAFAGWSVFRRREPLAGLTALGFALALNGYYGSAPFELVALFIGLTVLLTATTHFSGLERDWARRGVDYSLEIRIELLLTSGVIAMGLLAFSYFLPTVNLRAISRAVLDRPAVQRVEESLERIFAGVRLPETDQTGSGAGSGPGVGRSVMPRSFLLGNPPELSETVVFSATVRAEVPSPTHWRGFSYDIYTGRGWAVSEERQEAVAAGVPIPSADLQEQQLIEQEVHWLTEPVNTRYSLGLPGQFDQDVIVFWRGLEDLSRVRSEGAAYSAVSRVSAAGPGQLQQAALVDVPPAILARYTALPESVPERVWQLAVEIAADASIGLTPYDQAKALERFLRQYPYTLEVDLPPGDRDPVDFFLFDLQQGYCDYYASAMVVLARSLGLPARLATGYLAQPSNDAGQQTVYQINAHSWAEVYFAGYGWIEFEPTAPFMTAGISEETAGPAAAGDQEPGPESPPPPIPQKDRRSWWPLWFLALLPAGLAAWWLYRRQQTQGDKITWAYGRLLHSARRLGQATPPSQTPAEFESALIERLQQMERQAMAAGLHPVRLDPEIRQLTAAFVARQYSGRQPPAEEAERSWRRARLTMWMLGVVVKLQKLLNQA